MKKITILLSAATLLVFFAATAFKPLPPGPSANGQGTLSPPVSPSDGFRHFSFHAKTMPGGSVQGSGVLTYIGGDLKIKFDIDCLVVTGNTATMSGIITTHDQNPLLVGTRCRFKVQDNGEGANATEDRITLLQVGLPPAFPCVAIPATGLALNPIEGGNIQVKN